MRCTWVFNKMYFNFVTAIKKICSMDTYHFYKLGWGKFLQPSLEENFIRKRNRGNIENEITPKVSYNITFLKKSFSPTKLVCKRATTNISIGYNKRVVLEVPLVSILSPSKNDVAIKITIWSKFNNDQSQAQWWF